MLGLGRVVSASDPVRALDAIGVELLVGQIALNRCSKMILITTNH